MTQSPRSMKDAVSFFSSLSESAVGQNAIWYNKCPSFTKRPLPAARRLYGLIPFLWLFDAVRLLKGIHKFETINIAFIFSSAYLCLSSVTRGKQLCIFFPQETVQVSHRTCVRRAVLCSTAHPRSCFCSSKSVGFHQGHDGTSRTKTRWLCLSLLKNGLLPSSRPSLVSAHLKQPCCRRPRAAVTLSPACSPCDEESSGSACGGRLSFERVLSGVLRRRRGALH